MPRWTSGWSLSNRRLDPVRRRPRCGASPVCTRQGWWTVSISPLPTRAAAKQIFDRVNRFVANMFPADGRPEPVLAVPGYLRSGNFHGQRLHDYQVWWDDNAADGRRWAAESPKRFLAAQIAVGTVDQVMLGSLRGEERPHASFWPGPEPAGGGRGSTLRMLI